MANPVPRAVCWILLAASLVSAEQTADELTVLRAAPGEPAPSAMMTSYLQNLTRAALDRRAAAYEQLETPEQINAYQQRMRALFIEELGGLPERTPLNGRVVGRIDRDDCRVEKIIYESRPGFFVTAALYLPLSPPPYPGVLVPCGHSMLGKAYEPYQRACILLARNGIAALCYDPIGQGERVQLLDHEGRPRLESTHEHTALGVGCILLGINTATYRVWDGIRGIDYLVSRSEIDLERIGCTGNSGGGTLTSYISAIDPRVRCAAPSCYLTSFRRLLDTIGPQDAEQNVHAQIAHGLDHADYVMLRAPRPTLICAATHDFFDIGGTWDTFRQVKRLYTRMGFAERVDLVETDAKHGFSTELRVGMVRWMRRWLLQIDEPITEPGFAVLTPQELQCTPGGQVLRLEGARSVVDLNAELAASFADQRRRFWSETPRGQALRQVRRLAGIRRVEELPPPEVTRAGSLNRDGYRVEKLALHPEPGIVLPALLFVPGGSTGGAYLYLHGEGKHVDAGPGGPIERLVQQGHPVLAVDLRGIGETRGASRYHDWTPLFGSGWQDFFRAYLLGRSFVGMRAEDVLVCARYLASSDKSGAPEPVHVVGVGEAGPAVLHAAAVEPDRFASVRLEDAIASWSELIRAPMRPNQLMNAVHAALRTYDLPDLAALLPAEKVRSPSTTE